MSLDDLLGRIDALTELCCHCERPLGESPSPDFCSETCQEEWHEARAEPLADVPEIEDTLSPDWLVRGPIEYPLRGLPSVQTAIDQFACDMQCTNDDGEMLAAGHAEAWRTGLWPGFLAPRLAPIDSWRVVNFRHRAAVANTEVPTMWEPLRDVRTVEVEYELYGGYVVTAHTEDGARTVPWPLWPLFREAVKAVRVDSGWPDIIPQHQTRLLTSEINRLAAICRP